MIARAAIEKCPSIHWRLGAWRRWANGIGVSTLLKNLLEASSVYSFLGIWPLCSYRWMESSRVRDVERGFLEACVRACNKPTFIFHEGRPRQVQCKSKSVGYSAMKNLILSKNRYSFMWEMNEAMGYRNLVKKIRVNENSSYFVHWRARHKCHRQNAGSLPMTSTKKQGKLFYWKLLDSEVGIKQITRTALKALTYRKRYQRWLRRKEY